MAQSTGGIHLKESTINRITEYAITANRTVSAAVNEAINEWMDSTGDLLISELERDRQKTHKPRKRRYSEEATCISSNSRFRNPTRRDDSAVTAAVSAKAMV